MSKTSSPSKVIKIPAFQGSLPTRALYIYLPPGYADSPQKSYPLLYMHDGQNCFASYEQDSYAGSWRADKTADRLIKRSEIEPCVIVGVSNGQQDRLAEYLPPYVQYHTQRGARRGPNARKRSLVMGQADKTFNYYQQEVDPYIRSNYRILGGRENIATCGSSMGGLFSAYIALDNSSFARSHALMSPSFWITHRQEHQETGSYEIIERFHAHHPLGGFRDAHKIDSPENLRLWLDCGSWGGAEGEGDDGLPLLLEARDALVDSGFEEGDNFQVYFDEGAIHHEGAWASRFDRVLRFLFPIRTDKDAR